MADQPILIVDLDGSLLKTDLLYETFFELAATRFFSIPITLRKLIYGKSVLKSHLVDCTDIDISLLPINESVLEFVRAYRDRGGRAVLATASDRRLAVLVADHLGCFDDVFGSDTLTNLKGHIKAEFLVEKFGTGNFDYVGDSRADLSIWRHARRAIVVNAGPSLRRAVSKVAPDVVHLDDERSVGTKLRAYVRALRPHQWLKNILVFLPAIAAHSDQWAHWLNSIIAFAAFSAVASSVYVWNDLFDLAADRAHPRKRNRPFASGAVPLAHGPFLGGALLVLGMALALVAGSGLLLVLIGYFALTLCYSVYLKRRLVIDICALAGLYTMRVLAGSAATDLPPSPWILAFSIFVFLSLAAVKRQAELVDGLASGKERSVGRAYESADLPIVAMMALASGYQSVLVLAFYIDTPAVKSLYGAPSMLWGVCPILLFWISRIVMITHRGRMDDDPIVFAVRDRVSQMCGVAIALLVVAGSAL